MTEPLPPSSPAAVLPPQQPPAATTAPAPIIITEILPKNGLVYSEKSSMVELLCKPKILPIKSQTLERLEQLEQNLAQGQVPTSGSTNPGGSGLAGGRLGQ